jgi:NTE family protein
MNEVPVQSNLNIADFEDRARGFAWSGGKLEPGIGLALSGGGYRAMLFHAGALARLNEFGLLSKAARISSVSGGSIAAGYLAKIWTTLRADGNGVFSDFTSAYVDKMLAFSRNNLDVVDALLGQLPFHTVAEEVATSYDDLLFEGVSLQSLPDAPRFVFCATNLQTGVCWRFSKPYAGDYVIGYLENPDIRLALAVAASAAFPPFLSPLTLTPPAGAFKNWPSDGPAPDPAPFREKVLLVDGGVYDNHGLEPIVKRYMTLFVSDGGAPFVRMNDVRTDWLSQLRRVLELEDNQSRALRRRDLMMRLTKGNADFARGALGSAATDSIARMGAYWGIDTNADSVAPPDALPCKRTLVEKLAETSTRLSDPGELRAKQLVNWGYAVCDRVVRVHYNGPVKPLETIPAWLYSDAPIGP